MLAAAATRLRLAQPAGLLNTWVATALPRGRGVVESSASGRAPLSSSTAASSSATSTTSPPPPRDHLHVQLEPLAGDHDGIFCLSLTRPEAKNAIGRQLLRELQEAIAALRSETTTRAVVVRSAVPGAFCAGADLRERARMTPREASSFVAELGATLTALASLPMPTIAAVDGVALGGGAELALACDVRVVGPGGVFAFPEARLGIIPGAGGCARLPRLVGPARALDLIATSRRVGPAEAVALGLANYEATGEDAEASTGHRGATGAADARALALARSIAGAAPLALRAAKAAVVGGAGLDMAGALALEAASYATLLGTRDRLEGLAAFAQKRAPVWRGE